MRKRKFLAAAGALLGVSAVAGARAASRYAEPTTPAPKLAARPGRIEPLQLSAAQWRQRLTPMQYAVLREEATERPHSHPLNKENRDGDYLCAGCGLLLFTADMKYDSGTGWPSFFRAVEKHIATKTDRRIPWSPRTEYHCKRCGGHQGHVFDDGPQPTGKRWCNNGVALLFVAAEAAR